MSLFAHIRRLATARWARVVALFMVVMCSVTWVAQAVSSVQDSKVLVTLAAIADALPPTPDTLPDAQPADCAEEAECESVPLVALDETHDVKLFFLREFTHLFQPVVARMARNRDLAAILRMSSETFRPPDQQIGFIGRPFAS